MVVESMTEPRDDALSPLDFYIRDWQQLLWDATGDQRKVERVLELARLNGMFDPIRISRPAPLPRCEAAPVTWPSVNEYVAGYEYRGDQDYAPNDGERAMIEDAIHGYLITCTPTTPLSRLDAESAALDAVYDALGDIEVDDSGKCRWSDVANIQRHVYQMARDATLVPPPSEAGREALEACREFLVGMTKPAKVGSYVGSISSYHPCHALIDKIDRALSPDPGTVAVASTLREAGK